MGSINSPTPILPLICAFSRHSAALDWVAQRATEFWGPLALASERFVFAETGYYDASMGTELRKCFWVTERLADPAQLAAWKIMTNGWEDELAAQPELAGLTRSEERPVNIDPGYITMAKLLLASTKDHAHRIYLERGIFAEITLMYRHKKWEHHEWTFPDYRRADYQAFFSQARLHLKRQLALHEGA